MKQINEERFSIVQNFFVRVYHACPTDCPIRSVIRIYSKYPPFCRTEHSVREINDKFDILQHVLDLNIACSVL